MSIENMFGDLHSIDIMAETKTKEVLLKQKQKKFC